MRWSGHAEADGPAVLEREGRELFHGYAPDVPEDFGDEAPRRPAMSVAINRQTGSRSRAVAKRVAEILDCQFLAPESLELMGDALPELMADLEDEELDWWHEQRLEALSGPVGAHPEMHALVDAILAVAAKGSAVLVGKGAGAVLPAESTLSVLVVADEADRVALAAESRRLPPEAAARSVAERDLARQRYLMDKFGFDGTDLTRYDLVVNSSRLGVETAAQLVAAAARVKSARHS